MGSGVSAIEQIMIVAVSAFHFGRQIVVADAQGQTRVRNASPAVALYNAVCAADRTNRPY
jgi:hypothetical protein